MPPRLDQHLPIPPCQGGDGAATWPGCTKAAMRINCLVKEEGSSALNGNNGRLHRLLSHNIIKDRIKGREYSKWLAGKTC